LGQLEAHLAIARKFAGTGEYQVAHSGQPQDGFEMATQLDAETGHFGPAPGDDPGALWPTCRPSQMPAANGHDVFQRSQTSTPMTSSWA
jgi:hypothetical protein